jgi:hypothetical protein
MSSNKTTEAKRDAAIRALVELFSNPKLKAHVYHRYILVQHPSGQLVFEQDHSISISSMLWPKPSASGSRGDG